MGKETSLSIQMVNGGFIMTSMGEHDHRTEVFTSQGKLMKAVRSAIDEGSLVKKEKSDDSTEGQEKV